VLIASSVSAAGKPSQQWPLERKRCHASTRFLGPGSAYVNEAKRQVFGAVGIDQLAGLSEIFIVADAAPAWH
jgi:hypothetical protein